MEQQNPGAEQQPSFEVPAEDKRMPKEELEQILPVPESPDEYTYSELRSEFINTVATVAVKSRPRRAAQKRTPARPN